MLFLFVSLLPSRKLIRRIHLEPQERQSHMDARLNRMSIVEQGPCGGFSHMYKFMCDYFDLPYLAEVAWVSHQWHVLLYRSPFKVLGDPKVAINLTAKFHLNCSIMWKRMSFKTHFCKDFPQKMCMKTNIDERIHNLCFLLYAENLCLKIFWLQTHLFWESLHKRVNVMIQFKWKFAIKFLGLPTL